MGPFIGLHLPPSECRDRVPKNPAQKGLPSESEREGVKER